MRKKTSFLSKLVFRFFRFFGKIAYRKTKIYGLDSIPESDTVIVANHAQLSGPVIAELHMPENCYIWANGQMFSFREVPDYAMEDFFPYKRGMVRPAYRIASYILAPLMPCIMKNARTVPVYHDARIASTLRTTLKLLVEGNNILVFPECHEPQNNIINKFREYFVDIARLYEKRRGVRLKFIPMYISPELKSCYFGQEILYDPNNKPSDERRRITEHLATEITRIGRSLPPHTVVPFDNISRKDYISNKDFDSIPRSTEQA